MLAGAGGQLAWEVARRAPSANMSVVALSQETLDITDSAAVHDAVARVAPRVVVNGAAYTAVDKAETESKLAFAVNRDGPAHLAAACAARDVPFIHISTDYVFDGEKEDPYTEEDQTAPLGVYGASKLAGESAVRGLLDQHVILRTAWVHGVHGHNFVKTMLRLGAERDTLRVVDDQHGSPTFAGDLADAVLALARRLTGADVPGEAYGTFHCTGSGTTTWYGLARRIFEIAGQTNGRNPRIEPIATAQYPTPARRPANSVLDCGKLARVHGIMLRRWDDALAEMLRSLLARGGV